MQHSEVRDSSSSWRNPNNLIVIGERLVTPSSIVYLILKLRIAPPTGTSVPQKELDVEETKRSVRLNEEKDMLFLNNRQDAEDLPAELANGFSHAPHWPGVSSSSATFSLKIYIVASEPQAQLVDCPWR